MYSAPYFWVDQNILGPIISDIRGSTVTSYTGPPYKTLAVDRTQGWAILDHARTHQTCSHLTTEAGNYRREGLLLEAKVLYSSKEIHFTIYLCNTEHNISLQFLVNNPYLQRQKLRHLGSSPDFQHKSVGLVDIQHLPYLQNSLLTGSPLKSMKHFFKDAVYGCFALSNLPAGLLLACFFLFYCFMIYVLVTQFEKCTEGRSWVKNNLNNTVKALIIPKTSYIRTVYFLSTASGTKACVQRQSQMKLRTENKSLLTAEMIYMVVFMAGIHWILLQTLLTCCWMSS